MCFQTNEIPGPLYKKKPISNNLQIQPLWQKFLMKAFTYTLYQIPNENIVCNKNFYPSQSHNREAPNYLP